MPRHAGSESPPHGTQLVKNNKMVQENIPLWAKTSFALPSRMFYDGSFIKALFSSTNQVTAHQDKALRTRHGHALTAPQALPSVFGAAHCKKAARRSADDRKLLDKASCIPSSSPSRWQQAASRSAAGPRSPSPSFPLASTPACVSPGVTLLQDAELAERDKLPFG